MAPQKRGNALKDERPGSPQPLVSPSGSLSKNKKQKKRALSSPMMDTNNNGVNAIPESAAMMMMMDLSLIHI